jgi:hypothetical protein
MTEGKSPKQVGAKEQLANAGNNENRKDTCPNGIKNECDGMMPRVWEKMFKRTNNIRGFKKEVEDLHEARKTRKTRSGAMRRSTLPRDIKPHPNRLG